MKNKANNPLISHPEAGVVCQTVTRETPCDLLSGYK